MDKNSKEPIRRTSSNRPPSVTFAEDTNVFLSPTMEPIPPLTGIVKDSDDEEYSAKVNAIIERRASGRRRSRRRKSTSPNNEERRSSSFTITTSSGDTAITVEEPNQRIVTQEQIFENIKIHKEVLENVKLQPWDMRKKLKFVKQAKTYIKKHEGALQERLANSGSARDRLARCYIYFLRKSQKLKRELSNTLNWFIPWEQKIKEIESHFGSVVASYFLFLRWLFWVNLVIAIILICFVMIPEVVIADSKEAGDRKVILPEEKYSSTNFLTLWDFKGYFEVSPLFYGWYTNNNSKRSNYRLNLAYFLTGLLVYAYSFFATLRKMAKNSRMSKLSEKDDECVFSWKLFTAWDYMIGNSEAAHNRVAAIITGFKEALLEEAEKKKVLRTWKVTAARFLVNVVIFGLFVLSVGTVAFLVKRSIMPDGQATFWRRNELSIVMTLISTIFPMIFDAIGFFEQYHPRKQLRIQLARIMALNLLNLYSLIISQFDKIYDISDEMSEYFMKLTSGGLKKNKFKAPQPSLNSDKIVYCYQRCYQNVSKSSFLMATAAALVFNSSFLVKENSTAFSTSTAVGIEDYDFENHTNLYFDSSLNSSENANVLSQLSSYISSMFYGPKTLVLNEVSYEKKFDSTTENFVFNENVSYNENGLASSTENYSFIATKTLASSTEQEDLNETISDYVTVTNFENTSSSTTTNPLEKLEVSCEWVCEEEKPINMTEVGRLIRKMNNSDRRKLRNLCWETMFGQELVKLTVMDLIVTFLSTLTLDFFRGIFIRVFNSFWCWDLEKVFPKYADFKVAENILHLVNNQGLIWMGLFFSPGLAVINTFKLYILLYLRAWTVLTCNVPPEIIFRASKSNNFYYALLLMMLFLCVLPVGYAIVWVEPSWYCGPFSGYKRIYHIFTQTVSRITPPPFDKALEYIASPGSVIPLLVLLILFIYYLTSLTSSLREANAELKLQLRRERTEERRKMFRMVDKRHRTDSNGSGDVNNPFYKWKKLLNTLPNNTAKTLEEKESFEQTRPSNERRDFLVSLFKNALKKNAGSSGGEGAADEISDSEHFDSLPHDTINNCVRVENELKRQESSTSSKKSEDYSIPTITINDNNENDNEKFKPFVKCVLKKQNHTEIDEETMMHFHHVIERKTQILIHVNEEENV